MDGQIKQRYELAFRLYPYQRSPDQDLPPKRHKVVVVGGGPIGLAMALDLGRQGIPVLVLDDHEGVGAGSRAICFAKRTLEICDRLGASASMMEKGVIWSRGKVFHDDRQLYSFDLQPEAGHQFPAFINLQQPYFEKFLHEAILAAQAQGAPIEIRGANRVEGIVQNPSHATLSVTTPEGPYSLEADWVVACDGARSPLREMMGLGFEGRVFEDNFLIADVRMKADFPTERWFWFEPHFKSGASALLHRQPDDIWRIDFQLGWNIDRALELQPERIRARVDAMLGGKIDYEVVWSSIYTFQCRRMRKFRHDRVIFAGDSAHQVSPFGARGANSGIQDVDNLGWKLAMVLQGQAPEALLDSYDRERVEAADENILNSTRATDFITPKSKVSKGFRDAVLSLAATHPFARSIVNSGRLSQPCLHEDSPLSTPDTTTGLPERSRPGAPAIDAPLPEGWLLRSLPKGFCLLAIGLDAPQQLEVEGIVLTVLPLPPTPEVSERYLGKASTALYLLRPDHHIAARWHDLDAHQIAKALARALGKEVQ